MSILDEILHDLANKKMRLSMHSPLVPTLYVYITEATLYSLRDDRGSIHFTNLHRYSAYEDIVTMKLMECTMYLSHDNNHPPYKIVMEV